MASRLLIFFNGGGPPDPPAINYEWRDEQGKTERSREDESSTKWPPGPNKPFNIKQVFLDKGRSEISEFDIVVSSPSHLYPWLQSNDATELSMLSIFSSALDVDDDALPNKPFSSSHDTKTSEWQRLFELLASDGVAPNLKRLKIYWDCEGCYRGLGKSVDFIRALGKLRPREHVIVAGFYALNWPAYLEIEMCVPVIAEKRASGLEGFQFDTGGLIP